MHERGAAAPVPPWARGPGDKPGSRPNPTNLCKGMAALLEAARRLSSSFLVMMVPEFALCELVLMEVNVLLRNPVARS
jgi:hypothetical protein